MVVQFVTDNEGIHRIGFSTKIHYIPVNPICKDWLNITSGYLRSTDYPRNNCSWVISESMGTTISIQFQTFEVK